MKEIQAAPRLQGLKFIAKTAYGGRFDVDGQTLEVTAHAAGVFRMRLGPKTLPDYGLLATPDPSGPAPALIEVKNGWKLYAGRHALKLKANPFRIHLTGPDGTVLQSITDQHFRGWTRLPCFAKGDGFWSVGFALQSAESVYGLGEKGGRLDKRGGTWESRVEDALGVNTGLSYKNVPFAWSDGGWGVFVNTPGDVIHAIGDPKLSHRSYVLGVRDEALDLFLFAADAPAAIIGAFTTLTGRMPELPLWGLGAWVSRAYYKTPDEAIAAAQELRARRFPADVLVLDGRAWLDTDTRFAFEFDAKRYADPQASLAAIKAQDLRICVWEYPYVSTQNKLFGELGQLGYLLKDKTGQPLVFDWDKKDGTTPFGKVLTPLPASGILDFTNPAAYAWWRDRHGPLFALGVDVIKSDFGEQVTDDAVAHNGDSGKRLHNVYPRLYNACVYEATAKFKPGAPMVWGRSGWTGMQRTPIYWGGDPQSDWEGLAGSIRGGLSMGLSGVPCYATDIGGFYGDQPTPELYLRWVQAGVFCSHFRIHGIGPREPWAFGAEIENEARRWFELRYRLIPYIMGAIETARETGMPVQRAMALAFPRDRAAAAYDTQYMFGDALLVAPVLRADSRVEIWLPEGRWYDLWTHEAHDGGRALALTAPLDRIPVFGRDGHVLPLGPVVQHTGAINLDCPLNELWLFGKPTHRPRAFGTPIGLQDGALSAPDGVAAKGYGVTPRREAGRIIV